MVLPSSCLPDCSLRALRFGEVPAGMRHGVLREAARACAQYVLGGGVLGGIDAEASRFRKGHLHLLPLPPGAGGLPRREAVEAGLEALEAQWGVLAPGEGDRLRFLLGFCGELAKRDAVWLSWARLWLRARERRVAAEARERYRHRLEGVETGEDGVAVGVWHGRVETDAAGLLRAVEGRMREAATVLKRGRRADVWEEVLLGEEVVVKHFAPNPRRWKQGLGPTRARRAWAGSHVLRGLGLDAPEVMGFVERLEGGVPKDSYVVLRRIPDTVSLREWLRRRYHGMGAEARGRLRHRVREEVLRLYRHGIYHKDTKLHNLLVREMPGGGMRFWWIDLEDIRAPGRVGFWMVVRNFVQMNGSVPRRLPREERLAFVRGFSARYGWAAHPGVVAFVERKTRRRLRREVRGICRS